MLPAFTCASATGNPLRICFGVNILSPFPYFAMYQALASKGE